MSDLLALLGLSGARVVLYPGGMTACVLAGLWLWLTSGRLPARPPLRDPMLLARECIASVPLVLLLAWLPLPGATSLSRQLDLPTALELLEWPTLLGVVAALEDARERGMDVRLANLRLSYSVVLLSMLVVTQATHSLRLDALVAAPAQTDLLARSLRVGGAVVWALALVPLLEISPFAKASPAVPMWSSAFRAVGHVLLAALPWMAWVSATPLLVPLPPLLLAVLLAGVQRGKLGSERAWKGLCYAGVVTSFGLLAWAAIDAVQARL